MTTFAAIRSRCLLRAALDLQRGAEEVQYFPAGGGPERTITVRVQPVSNDLRDDQAEVRTIEEIDVRVSKDPDAADGSTPIGGVAEPQHGDGLLRSSDAPGDAWSYSHKVGSRETDDAWCLRFVRHRREQVGTTNMRR